MGARLQNKKLYTPKLIDNDKDTLQKEFYEIATAIQDLAAGGGGSAAPVTSVNTKTGDVVLNATDVGAIPTGGAYTKTEADEKFELKGQGGSVTSVNGHTGVVNLTASDVGALADTVNPVLTVNGHHGPTVTLTAGDVGTYTSAEIDAKIQSGGGTVDLTNYYTKAEVDTKEAATLAAAATHSDTNDATILKAAMLYTDQHVGSLTLKLTTLEDIPANSFINVYKGSVRLADRKDEGRECHGFVKEAVALGAQATVILSGDIQNVTGITTGRVWLDAGGKATTMYRQIDSKLTQQIGFAYAPNKMILHIEHPIFIVELTTTP